MLDYTSGKDYVESMIVFNQLNDSCLFISSQLCLTSVHHFAIFFLKPPRKGYLKIVSKIQDIENITVRDWSACGACFGVLDVVE